ncbi:MAG TPA: hypothetical protein VI685_24365, partial [Candidatus Angelobacter sp.]
LHIGCGVWGLLSGGAAMSFRKGSRRQGLAGDLFVISMLGLGASGAYLGFMKGEVSNVAASVFTCYLVATAWMTARRRERETGIFEWIALLVPLAIAATVVSYGIAAAKSPTGSSDGDPTGAFIFGSVVLLFAAGDIRMLARGGVSGKQRLVRHLVRMCVALFIASASLFLARPHLFPGVLVKTKIILLLGILPLLLMIFWLFRVWFSKAHKRKSIPAGADAKSLQTYVSISPSRKTEAGTAVGLRRSA